MADEPKFLRPHVIIEPLVDRFYAWLHTVAPAQAAMNLAFLQLPLLESYLQSPQVHISASGNPALRGGFFVNVEESRSGEIRDLVSSIRRDRAGMLRFAAAITEAEEVLRRGATGFDLTPLYPKLPPELDGLVELAYDTGNQPTMRYIEPLLYESSAYTEDRQSVQLSLDSGAERPFVLSTPRLDSPGVLTLGIPFRHPGLEELFRARTRGLPVIETDDFSEVEFPGGRVIATPFLGEHADLDIRGKSTYCVKMAGRTVYIGADSSGTAPGLYRYVRDHVGRVDLAFLGMECAGAPLTWAYQAVLTAPVSKKMSDSRTLSGSNAAQAAAIMNELGVSEAYVYAMGEETWLVGHVMATSYSEDSYQLKQVDEFMTWCAEKGIKAGHLFGQHEWRW